ncbi:MAG: hypothetical protein IAE94_09505 [Chthoniobacterales bacterium]|mgnify:CR=1 FL=1|nr:hypothetical protein [Chthoniobacterales bacterium]
MRTALALLLFAVLPIAYAGRIETLQGKLEKDNGKYVLCLHDAYTLEFGGENISSKRLQVEGWTPADRPKLDAAKGNQIELTGLIYPGTSEDSEKLVFFVKEVPPLNQTVIVIGQPAVPTPSPSPTPMASPTPSPIPSPSPTQTVPKETPIPRPPSIVGTWVTGNGVHDYSNVIILQFCDDNTGRIVNSPSGTRVSPKAYRFSWRLDGKSIWLNLLDGRTTQSGNDRGSYSIISISSSAMVLNLGDEVRTFTKQE